MEKLKMETGFEEVQKVKYLGFIIGRLEEATNLNDRMNLDNKDEYFTKIAISISKSTNITKL